MQSYTKNFFVYVREVGVESVDQWLWGDVNSLEGGARIPAIQLDLRIQGASQGIYGWLHLLPIQTHTSRACSDRLQLLPPHAYCHGHQAKLSIAVWQKWPSWYSESTHKSITMPFVLPVSRYDSALSDVSALSTSGSAIDHCLPTTHCKLYTDSVYTYNQSVNARNTTYISSDIIHNAHDVRQTAGV